MYSREQNNTTHSARHGAANTPEHSNHIYLPTSSLVGDPDAVAWLRAARCTGTRPHRASQAPIVCTASLHATPPFPSHKIEGLVGPLRPLSGSRSCGRPPRPRPLPFARALRADAWTKTGACGRTVRMPRCPWIFQAPTMSSAIGTENKILSRVARRESRSDRLLPYQ